VLHTSCGSTSIVVERQRQQPARRLVIGIGNADRGDDTVGRLVARLLKGRLPADVAVLEHDGETTGLLEELESADTAYLIDAAVSDSTAGAVRRFDCTVAALPADALQVSTHGLGLAEAIELARALEQLPARCVVFAIEASTVGTGSAVSGEIRAAAEAVAERIAEELWTAAPENESTQHA
jgi:hydrogenase maturation protease